MSANVSFSLGSLGANYCWSGAQQFAVDLISILTGTVPTAGKILIGANAPAPADQDGIWVRTVGGYLEGVYLYLGTWCRPHPMEPSSKVRTLYMGADGAADLWLFDHGDGGDPSTATATTGSFWQVDHAFDFKMPIGPGTNGVAYNGGAGTVISQGGTGGEEKHVLQSTETPYHTHGLNVQVASLNAGADWGYAGAAHAYQAPVGAAFGGDPGQANATAAHQNLPPYMGVFFIKRSVRQYITAS